MKLLRLRVLAFGLFLCTASVLAQAATTTQQQAYLKAEKAIGKNRPWNDKALASYPLLPYLQAQALRARLKRKPNAKALRAVGRDVEAFAKRYPRFPGTAGLLATYRSGLLKTGQWQTLLKSLPAKPASATWQCAQARGWLAAGKKTEALATAKRLWGKGKPQPQTCKPLFERFLKTGDINRAAVKQRFEAALNNSQLNLADYLAKRLGKAEKAEMSRWWRMRKAPKAELKTLVFSKNLSKNLSKYTYSKPLLGQRAVYGFRRLARGDSATAFTYFRHLHKKLPWSTKQRVSAQEYIAINAAQDFSTTAAAQINQLPKTEISKKAHEWRIRTHLRTSNWEQVRYWIEHMPDKYRKAEAWQYWHAKALQRSGDAASKRQARFDLSKLATKRDFYPFLAALELGQSPAFGHRPTTPNLTIQRSLERQAPWLRIVELLALGRTKAAGTEWQHWVGRMSPEEIRQLSLLAHQQGWHNRAIAGFGKLREFDDLTVRFPTPYRADIERFSAKAGIEPVWALSIMRSESLFDRLAKSRANARGLMQLLPGTGKLVARKIKVKWRGSNALYEPQYNVQLGTSYLAQMRQRFRGHTALASAAYNAGPGNVDRWLPKRGELPALLWIESIPYAETRKYVQRVMAYSTIFQSRLNPTHTFDMRTWLKPIKPKSKQVQP